MDPVNNPPAPEPSPVNQPPAQPPAAVVVSTGKSENEVALEAELEKERQARRKAEFDAGAALDEAARLREIQSRPAPVPTEKPRKPRQKSRFTLLHDEESESD